jgi:hypothetical protein
LRGNVARDTGKLVRMLSRSMPLQLIDVTLVLCRFVCSPLTVPKFIRMDLRLLASVVVGFRKMTASLRTMCGSKTGGWSLPCVMSD